MAYERIDPFGASRDDLRAGIIASTIANSNASKRSKTFSAFDFMPKFEEQKSPKTLSEKVKEVFKLGDTSKPSR